MNIVLIGAGSAQFGLGTLGDIFQSEKLKGSAITLLDINEKALDVVYQKAQAFINEHKLSFTLKATTNRKEALQNAESVIISIEVGNRFDLWDMDWTLPHQYGIKQVYGENGGPGGIFHSLRIIPPILEICQDVNDICPEAFVFCYSNPMTAITTTVLRKFPNMKFTGMCHEIASLERYLPTILDTEWDNLETRAAGLNHFSVLLSAAYKDSGKDAYGDVLAKAPAFFETVPGYSDILAYYRKSGFAVDTEGHQQRDKVDVEVSSRSWSDRTLFKELLEKFHLLPITVDSHLGEYISWAADVSDHQGILDFYTYYREILGVRNVAEIELKLKERVVPVMEGIVSNSGYEESAVNILNKGLIPSLPDDIAVEVPGKVYKDRIEGVAFPDYPKGFAALLRNYCGVYDMTAEAILNQSRDLLIQTLMVNPVIQEVRRLPEMVDVMIDRQRPWLDYLK